jgi:octaprenyl-diphosphate synthase
MAEGEVIQLQRAGDLTNTRETYLSIIDRKAASLIAWCASAGARMIGADAYVAAMERFGQNIGRAFQIADDVLDYRTTTDKLPGADLRERKVTLPLLYAMPRIDGLRERLEAGPIHNGDLGPMLVRIRNSGALEAALEDARSYVDDALDALDALPDTDDRTALRALAIAVVERTS